MKKILITILVLILCISCQDVILAHDYGIIQEVTLCNDAKTYTYRVLYEFNKTPATYLFRSKEKYVVGDTVRIIVNE